METNGWVKIHRKMFLDDKIRSLSMSKRYLFIGYIAIAQHEGRWRGYLSNELGETLSSRERAGLLWTDHSEIVRADEAFAKLGLIEKTAGGRIKIKNYNRYQTKIGGENIHHKMLGGEESGEESGDNIHHPGDNIHHQKDGKTSSNGTDINHPTTFVKRREEVKNTYTGAQQDEWMRVALLFRDHWPSTLQGRPEKTRDQLAEKYAGEFTGHQIEAKIRAHANAGTMGLKPWTIMSTPVEVKPRYRTQEEQDFCMRHDHYPDDLEDAKKCPICQKASKQSK